MTVFLGLLMLVGIAAMIVCASCVVDFFLNRQRWAGNTFLALALLALCIAALCAASYVEGTG